jgi:hypothetical protein
MIYCSDRSSSCVQRYRGVAFHIQEDMRCYIREGFATLLLRRGRRGLLEDTRNVSG